MHVFLEVIVFVLWFEKGATELASSKKKSKCQNKYGCHNLLFDLNWIITNSAKIDELFGPCAHWNQTIPLDGFAYMVYILCYLWMKLLLAFLWMRAPVT